jgi:signal transduction histidine kinase
VAIQSFIRHLADGTVETQFIFTLFHLLLAALAVMVLLHHRRATPAEGMQAPHRRLLQGSFLFVLDFSVRLIYFGAAFYFRTAFQWTQLESLSHGLRVCGVLVVVSAYLLEIETKNKDELPLARWILWASIPVTALALAGMWLAPSRWGSGWHADSAVVAGTALLPLFAIGFGIRAVRRDEREGHRATWIALVALGFSFFLHGLSPFLSLRPGTLPWNADQHLVSISFFAFAWAAGERSGQLLDRVFVRLNLTFIVLASLIMLVTANMEKYQYLLWAQQRSTDLAEFLRGHVLYYTDQEESLEQIFRRPEVLRRVVVEFGTLPELREIDVSFDGMRASFRYSEDWEIKQEIGPVRGRNFPEPGTNLTNTFQMIRLPIQAGAGPDNSVEFLGTMDYLYAYIAKYIVVIYALFTVTVGLATGVIGIIVNNTDRQLRRQYAELRETHQQLAQTAKLASVGQLAGGMAHEINNPITSILSMATYLAGGKNAETLNPRQFKSLQLIVQQAQRVSKIVGNLLAFARQTHLELSRVDVGELLDTAVSLVEYRLNGSAIHLQREADADLPAILGDASRLTEVIINLLNNAIDAMPGGGLLTVRACSNPEPDGGVRVEVADTGCGIAPELLPRIFDPFFTTKEPGRGTGLGLSISHGVVKDHGGQIWAESSPGYGTKMVVTLPKEVN